MQGAGRWRPEWKRKDSLEPQQVSLLDATWGRQVAAEADLRLHWHLCTDAGSLTACGAAWLRWLSSPVL